MRVKNQEWELVGIAYFGLHTVFIILYFLQLKSLVLIGKIYFY